MSELVIGKPGQCYFVRNVPVGSIVSFGDMNQAFLIGESGMEDDGLHIPHITLVNLRTFKVERRPPNADCIYLKDFAYGAPPKTW